MDRSWWTIDSHRSDVSSGTKPYRNHLSYIKDLTPEIGRSLKAVYGLRF